MNPEKYQSIIKAAWDLAESSGLDKLELSQVALKTQVPLFEVEAIVPNQLSLLLLLISDVLAKIVPIKSDMLSEMDNIFDTMMAGFDTAQPHHKAIQKIWRDLTYKPLLLIQVMAPFQKKIAEFSEILIPEKTLLGDLIDTVGFQAIFIRVFLTWVEDETLDLSKTMAALDQSLKQYTQVKTYLTD